MGMHAVCAMQPFSETLTGLPILQVTSMVSQLVNHLFVILLAPPVFLEVLISVAKHLLKSQLVPENN